MSSSVVSGVTHMPIQLAVPNHVELAGQSFVQPRLVEMAGEGSAAAPIQEPRQGMVSSLPNLDPLIAAGAIGETDETSLPPSELSRLIQDLITKLLDAEALRPMSALEHGVETELTDIVPFGAEDRVNLKL